MDPVSMAVAAFALEVAKKAAGRTVDAMAAAAGEGAGKQIIAWLQSHLHGKGELEALAKYRGKDSEADLAEAVQGVIVDDPSTGQELQALLDQLQTERTMVSNVQDVHGDGNVVIGSDARVFGSQFNTRG